MRAAANADIRLLGIVENMAGYRCGDCGAVGPLFAGAAGERLAGAFGIPLMGRLPFANPALRRDEPGTDGETLLNELLRVLA
jgi:ATP-binding protein involved in chromosome partitioning